jgi:4-hydroxy-tetrahydrodipicolinate synthase
MIFQGLSGFPITPLKNNSIDFDTLKRLRDCIDTKGLDSIGVLGSTGSFAYLSQQQRAAVFECWAEVKTPWIAGVSATSTTEAIKNCKIAYDCGASGVIANAFSYLPLNDAELTRYFLEIADASKLPVCVYDNPATTGHNLHFDILQALAAHPNIQGAKVFAQADNREQQQRLNALDWQPGYAVDPNCSEALIGGGSAWYSTLAGTAPELAVPVMTAIKTKDYVKARELNSLNTEIYDLMKQYSGYRIVHLIANMRGWHCELPSPLLFPEGLRQKIQRAFNTTGHGDIFL